MIASHRLLVAVAGLLAALTYSACSTDPETAKQEYLKSGNRFFEQKKFSEAIVQYRNALQHDEKFGEARYKLAQAYEQFGDGRNAFREYVRAADAMPGSAEAQVKAGTYLLAVGQLEEARDRADKALKKDPKSVSAQILLGNSLAGLKDFDSALRELEEAVKLDPKSATAITSLGRIQLAAGSGADAEASFRKAAEVAPGDASAHLALAQYLWASRRWNEAEASLRQALQVQPDNPSAHRALATLHTIRGRILEAEPHLVALAARDTSPSAPLKMALADYYLTINRWDDALKVLEQISLGGKSTAGAAGAREALIAYARKGATEGNRKIDEVLARDPKSVPALIVKARFLSVERKYEEAIKLAKAASQTDPTSLQAHFLLGTLYKATNQVDEAIGEFTEVLKLNPRAVAAQLSLADLSLAKGAREQALRHSQDAVRQLPNSGVAQLTLVRGLVANRKLARADEIARALVRQNPKSPHVHNAAASVAMASGNLVKARRDFSTALELDPKNVDAWAGLVALDVGERKLDEARARVDARLAQTPDDSQVLILAAGVYVATDQARAEQLLRKSIEVDPSSMDGFGLLAQLYMSQKRLPQARASLEEIVKQRPNAIGPQTMIAILYQAEGNLPEARKRYERIMQTDPSAAVAANNLAFIYAEDGGNLDLALQLAQTAKQKLPDSSAVADTLGWIYVKKEMASLAIPQLEQAVKVAPMNAKHHYHLGVALAKMGEAEKGRKALEKALDLKLEPRTAEEARKLIAQLQS